MEAMTFSLPVVATNVGDNSYLIKEQANGFLCNVGDWETIAERLLLLCNSGNMCYEFGKQSFQIINNDFSLERMEEKYISLINSLTC